MLRYYGDEIPQKSFFSTKNGYSSWDSVNNEYQVQGIHFFRGWTRALVDFAGGINCRESIRSIGKRYQSLPHVNLVYLDMKNECRYFFGVFPWNQRGIFFSLDLECLHRDKRGIVRVTYVLYLLRYYTLWLNLPPQIDR